MPKPGSDDRATLIELMTKIESIRPSDSVPGLYSLVYEGKILLMTSSEYEQIRASARQMMSDNLRKVRTKAADAEYQYLTQLEINQDQWFVSGVVRFFGGISDPGESIRQNTRFARANADAAQALVERGGLVRGAEFFAQSEVFATLAKKASQAYVNDLISTAETTVTVLEVTAVVAAATVVVIAAVLAAPLVVAAAEAAPLILMLSTAALPAAEVTAAAGTAVEVTAIVGTAAEVTAAAGTAVEVTAIVGTAAEVTAAAPVAAAAAVPAAAPVAAAAVPAAAPAVTSSAVLAAAAAAASTTLSSDSPAPADTGEEEEEKKKKPRPPFVLRLPQEKAPHLAIFQMWIGPDISRHLRSDPGYERGNPAQLHWWHQAHRLGGSDPIPAEVYQRGHQLGLTGEEGERRIRVPNWSPGRKPMSMEVDHIIELQVTPPTFIDHFNSMANYELLDRRANGTAGPQLRANIAAERAKQVAYDPSAKTRILLFDAVVIDGGSPGERWTSDDVRSGAQLDALPE